MKLLLDTHILIWSQLAPEKIPAPMAAAIENTENELWFSPISTWEMIHLIRRGRVNVNDDLYRWVERVVDGMHEAVLNRHVAAESRRIDLSHDDPADRFIAATAKIYELVLVTADAKLLNARDVQVLR